MRKDFRIRYNEMVEKGLCTVCGSPAKPGGLRCEACINYGKITYQYRKKHGMCTNCGKDKATHGTRCDKCWEYMLEYRRKKTVENREKRIKEAAEHIDYNVKFGELIRQHLKASGKTQKDLASLLNTTCATISRYVNGVRMPDIYTFAIICNYLNIDSNEWVKSVGYA